ncbi:hypothetical protein EJ653_12390, partial [Pseudomonas aeruginosa]
MAISRVGRLVGLSSLHAIRRGRRRAPARRGGVYPPAPPPAPGGGGGVPGPGRGPGGRGIGPVS